MRQDRYLVGYKTAGNVVYGKRNLRVTKATCNIGEDYTDPMTLKQAQRGLKKMPQSGAVIYKLVEVK